MTVFLTSSPTIPLNPANPYGPCTFNTTNAFREELRRRWKQGSRCLFVCSNPEDWTGTELYAAKMERVLLEEGMTMSSLTVWDGRSGERSREEVQSYDVLLLAGGHVPTQNAFLRKVGLREKLKGYQGLVIGTSAGSMNCADVVYAQPELPGESVDPDYQRFLPGLGLTSRMILPHFQAVRHWYLDGRRIVEDITYADSMGSVFYALTDGSYVLEEQGRAVVYGEAYTIADGVLTQICEKDQHRTLP